MDDAVLSAARAWIAKHQKADGSFEPVGFVHHAELLGGLKGKDALTAYVAVALMEAGDDEAAGKAIGYLEDRIWVRPTTPTRWRSPPTPWSWPRVERRRGEGRLQKLWAWRGRGRAPLE